MAFGVGRGVSTPLLVINFILYLIAACLAGWALNRQLDGRGVGNSVTSTFLPIALIASMVGLASVFAGTHHIRIWRGDSLAAAAATSLIAWLLTLLAMGLAAKEIHTGGYRPKRLKTLEAFMIILSLFELLYLLSIHGGYAMGGNNTGYAGDRAGPKGATYGTPAATAV